MERRVLLAISLSFVVLFLFQSLVPPAPEPTPGATPAAGSAPVATPGTAASGPAAAAAAPAAPAAAAVPALLADEREREFTVSTNDVEAVFTNRGARLRHWRLKAFRDGTGAVLDLVPADAAILPFSLSTADAAQTARLNEALFQVENLAPERVDATATPAVLSFVYEGSDGLKVRKQFAFEPSGYGVTLTPEATLAGTALNPVFHWGPGLGDEIARSAGSGGMFSGTYIYPAEGFVHRDGEVTRFASTAASTAGSQQGPFQSFGVNDHYFVAAVIAPPGSQRVDFAYVPLPDVANPAALRQLVSFSAAFDAPPPSLRFFVGPKQFEALRQVNPEFTKVINSECSPSWPCRCSGR